MSRERNEEERRREVEGWRASGQSAAVYAKTRGYSMSSLMRWASRERGESGQRFVRVEVASRTTSELSVEVGGARIRVTFGFDAALLREVIAALETRGFQ